MEKWELLYGYVCEQEEKAREKSNEYFENNDCGEDWGALTVKATAFESIRYAMDTIAKAEKKMSEAKKALHQ